MPLKILLMGTGEFALPAFRAVLESQHCVPLVVTQPDKTGRGHHQHVNVVRRLAEEFSVPVIQPQRINQPEVLDQLRRAEADLFLVASYGQILRPPLLAIPPLGAFNLHGSLLPKYRGAAPVQYSIWRGDTITGVTIFRIEPSLDSGPMACRVETPIDPHETSGELMLRLASLCVPLTIEFLRQVEAGTATLEPQDASQVVLSPKIQREDGRIDWSQTSRAIDCQIRAMQPWPKASAMLVRPGQPPVRCLFQQVRVLATSEQPAIAASPGRVHILDRRLLVRSGDGWLEILSIQPEGRRPMEGTAFANGYSPSREAEFLPEITP
ncbi:MAG: Methionyl-tRNA formyltransferase [Planctomycetota bacterium]